MLGSEAEDSAASADSATAIAGHRAVATLAATTFLTMLPVTLLVPALKELIGDRFGASNFWTHFFQSCNLLGAAAMMPLVASICQRRGSRAATVAAALVADAALLAGMGFAGSLQTVLAIRFLEGVTHILALTTLMAMAADRADPRHRGRTMGLIGACMMLGTAAGTRIGGRVPAEATFFVASGLSLAAAAVGLLTLRDVERRGERKSATDAMALIVRQPRLLVAYGYTLIDRFCVGVIITSFVLFLGNVHALDQNQRSRLLVMFLLPFALLVYPAGRLVDRVGTVIPLTLGSSAFGVLMGLYGFVPTEWMPVLMVASGVLSSIMFAPTLSLCADLAPADERGAAYAGFNAAGSLGFLLGPLIGGAVVHLASPICGATVAYQVTFVLAGGTQVIISAMTLFMLLRLRREGAVR